MWILTESVMVSLSPSISAIVFSNLLVASGATCLPLYRLGNAVNSASSNPFKNLNLIPTCDTGKSNEKLASESAL